MTRRSKLVLVTHQPAVAARLDRIVRIRGGRVVDHEEGAEAGGS